MHPACPSPEAIAAEVSLREQRFGPLSIGLVVSAVLFGITTVQSAAFLSKRQGEPFLHKFAVAGLWLLDLLSTVFLENTLYHFLVTIRGPIALSHFFWSCKALWAMESIIIAWAQSLYILRIWRLANVNMIKRRLVLTGALVRTGSPAPPTLSELCFNTGVRLSGQPGVRIIYNLQTGARFEVLAWEVFSCLISTCIIDFSISTILVMLLARQPKGTSWTDSTAIVLASYALNTGLCNGVISTASIIAYAIDRRSYAFLGIRVILSTVHINSLVAMLNARHYFQKETPATVILQSHDARLTVSQGGQVYASRRRPTTADKERTPTINEAGLLQFDKTPILIGNQAGIVEVVIQREQSTTISRPLRS
ncbi:hypothetical protein PLEOSDRAFT_1106850 [Pleurotus ostreatus PC15]|uniref:DUF6534 domain-containing protein n=1 Tax=Pleurotus ostreatus (strain PC15) TaxID=1137138 RepID=A0A067NG68_PLEO1|nr:hypothetical protein PLEOSDRAFT_1106850 [Pleurotus ostreatus PC15]